MKSNRRVNINYGIKDINKLVLHLVEESFRPLLEDKIWSFYGFGKKPLSHGIVRRIFFKKCRLESFIIREVLIMVLVDIINGIKKSRESFVTKQLIMLGIIDRYLLITKNLFSQEQLLENLLYVYENYLLTEKKNLHSLIVYKAGYNLNKGDFAKFLKGTEKLLSLMPNGDFLLSSDYIKKIIESSRKEKKLNLTLSPEEYERISSLIKERRILEI